MEQVSKLSFQERLSQIGRDFNKLIYNLKIPKEGKEEVIIEYTGNEKLDGVFSSNADVVIRQVIEFAGSVKIKAIVKSSMLGQQMKNIVVYFDPDTPFYLKDGNKIIPNDKKLKQSINFNVECFNDFDSQEYNFGEVFEGDTPSFEFNYTGSDKITGVKGMCGCTDVNLDGNKIYGKLNTEGLKGNVAKTINVYFGEWDRQHESINGILIPNKNSRITTLAIRGNTIPRSN